TEKETTITPVKVYSNSLVPEKSFSLPPGYRKLAVGDNKLAVAGLTDVAVYQLGESLSPLGSRKFENKAVRDLALTADHVVLAAVDKNSRGSMILLSTGGKDLAVTGSIELQQDAGAIGIFGSTAVVLGKSMEGKDVASVVNISSAAMPSISGTIP